MQFSTDHLGKVTILDQKEVYDFVYEVEVPVRLIVQATGNSGEGSARLLGASVGCRQFRAHTVEIDVHAYTADEFAYPAMNRVHASLEVVGAAALAAWIGDALDLSWEVGHELPDALDIPFEQAVCKPAWRTAPEIADEVEHDLYDLPSSKDDAPAKGMIIQNGEVVEEKDRDFWF